MYALEDGEFTPGPTAAKGDETLDPALPFGCCAAKGDETLDPALPFGCCSACVDGCVGCLVEGVAELSKASLN